MTKELPISVLVDVIRHLNDYHQRCGSSSINLSSIFNEVRGYRSYNAPTKTFSIVKSSKALGKVDPSKRYFIFTTQYIREALNFLFNTHYKTDGRLFALCSTYAKAETPFCRLLDILLYMDECNISILETELPSSLSREVYKASYSLDNDVYLSSTINSVFPCFKNQLTVDDGYVMYKDYLTRIQKNPISNTQTSKEL